MEIIPEQYLVELLFEEKPQIDFEKILLSIKNRYPKTISTENNTLIIFQDFQIKLNDGIIPPQIAVIISDKKFDITTATDELQQSWSCPEVKEMIKKVKYSIYLSDLMSRMLDYKNRLEIFYSTVIDFLKFSNCSMVSWKPSQQVLTREKILSDPEEQYYKKIGAINVRLFNIQDSDKKIMDTRGLSTLGLFDLQCMFENYDVNTIVRVLYNSAFYMFEKGNVIQNGDTVPGVNQEKWKCLLEESMVAPKRSVINIYPKI